MKNGTNQEKTGRKAVNYDRAPFNKDSVLVIISDIQDNTYSNAFKMENMILAAFPRLKESGIWTKCRVNKKHKNKCYITLPKDHHKENVSNIIKRRFLRKSGRFVMGGSQNWPIFYLFTVYALNKNFPKF